MANILDNIFSGKPTSRPPIWFMRQAGRVLPSYRKLRKKHSLKKMMNTPKLAAEVTILPLVELQVDAAILFSDILVIPEALGMKLSFTPKPKFEKPLCRITDIKNYLKPKPEKLNNIYETIDIVVKKKPTNISLIGFCGSPFTVLCYMYEGFGGKHLFSIFLDDFHRHPKKMLYLLEQITEITIEYAINQVKHGIDFFQLFDTHAGLISFDLYEKMVLPFVTKILKNVRQKGIPTIYFPKGIGSGLKNITYDITDAVSIDWQTPLDVARKHIGNKLIIQGNFNPHILLLKKEIIKNELEKSILFGKKDKKWIFNLGHGILPETPIKNLKYIVRNIKSTNWRE